MKLIAKDRFEQGTQHGVMLFRKGAEYSVEKTAQGFLVSHEPRKLRKTVRHDDGSKSREDVTESSTLVPAAVLNKMKAIAPIEVRED